MNLENKSKEELISDLKELQRRFDTLELLYQKDVESLSKSKDLLSESEEIWRSLCENSPNYLMLTDTNQNILFINHTGPDLKKEDAKGTNCLDFVPDKYLQKAKGAFKRVTETLEPDKFEFDYLSKNSSVISFEAWIVPVIRKGRVERFIVGTSNITEQKRIEAALRESEFFFKESQRVANIGSYKTRFSDGSWESSEVMDKIFGIDKNYNRTVEGWIDIVHPDDREMMDRYLQEEVIGGKKTFNKEYRIIRRSDGETRWVNGIGKLGLDSNGNVVSMIGTIQDITERKLLEKKIIDSEQKFKSAFYANPYIMSISDLQSGVLYEVNDAFVRESGYSRKELIGKSTTELGIISNEQRETFRLHYEAIGKIDGVETSICRKNGKKFWVKTYSEIIIIEDDKLVLTIAQDLTQQKKAENAVIESQRLSAIGEMASSVAHDFNNSLQAILGNMELAMLSSDLPDTIKEYLTVIKNSANDAATRVQMLQRFGGKKQRRSKYASLDIRNLIGEVISQLRPLWKDEAEEKGISVAFNLNCKDIPNIKGNEGELRSVFFNIIKNSIEAMPQGGTISVETAEKPEGVFVTIADNGSGMNEKIRSRVFQPFYTTKGFEKGRGLGMSGAYSIIQEHDGNISIKESAPGKGTAIEIVFPVTPDEAKPEINETTAVNDKSIRILWVEDELIILHSVKQMLAQLGYSCDTASSGGKALGMLEKNTYDLMVTDIGMPGMSGWQLAEIVKEKFKGQMKIAAVSGWGAQIEEAKIIEHGINYILGKPFSIPDLKILMEKVAREKR